MKVVQETQSRRLEAAIDDIDDVQHFSDAVELAQESLDEFYELVNAVQMIAYRYDRATAKQQKVKKFLLGRQKQYPTRGIFENEEAELVQRKEAIPDAVVALERQLKWLQLQLSGFRKDRTSYDTLIAELAGVPAKYFTNMRVSQKLNGRVSIYFGGYDRPDGDGFGHYEIDAENQAAEEEVVHWREPYEDPSRGDCTQVIAEARFDKGFGYPCRYRGNKAYVQSNKRDANRVDIFYGPNGPFGSNSRRAIVQRHDPNQLLSDSSR